MVLLADVAGVLYLDTRQIALDKRLNTLEAITAQQHDSIALPAYFSRL